jgi:parallel beta-helix repeat protein
MKPIAFLFAVMMVVSSLTYATIIHVPEDYASLHGALAVAEEGDTVLVQPGRYTGNINWPAVNGISLLSAGDYRNTIISGDFTSSVIWFEYCDIIDTTTVIRGFTITHGDQDIGGGVRLNEASPTIEACSIIGNTAGLVGGGILFDGSNAVIRDCCICQNLAYAFSGGMYGLYSSPTVENCIIQGNRRGGMRFDYGNPIIKDCTVDSNLGSWGWCSGLSFSHSIPIVDNCSIINNTHGGGVGCFYSDVVFSRLLIEGNSSTYYGAGICCWESSLSIEHCTIAGNSSSYGFNGIYLEKHSTPTISRCNIFRNGMGVYAEDSLHVLNCPNNWWGDVTGPFNPIYNPEGLGDSTNEYVNPVPFLTEPDSVAPPSEISERHFQPPAEFALFQNYPNPFNAVTNIAFELPALSKVSLKVYNILGREVATVLDDQLMSAGRHSVTFGNSNLSSGVYFYRIAAGRSTAVGKMVLLK